jgi:hypothetical protein
MNWLPDNYKVPTDSKYMKFQSGENTFRVLSNPVTGWEWWTSEVVEGKEVRRPNRAMEEAAIPVNEIEDEQLPKHFWAFVVWNYADEKVQILEITQKSLQMKIQAYSKSKGWGDPKGYDLVVTRTGEKLATKYDLMAIPPAPISKEIEKKYKEMTINLPALFTGDDPFSKEEKVDPDEIPDLK